MYEIYFDLFIRVFIKYNGEKNRAWKNINK